MASGGMRMAGFAAIISADKLIVQPLQLGDGVPTRLRLAVTNGGG